MPVRIPMTSEDWNKAARIINDYEKLQQRLATVEAERDRLRKTVDAIASIPEIHDRIKAALREVD